jgi:hypothetical protein
VLNILTIKWGNCFKQAGGLRPHRKNDTKLDSVRALKSTDRSRKAREPPTGPPCTHSEHRRSYQIVTFPKTKEKLDVTVHLTLKSPDSGACPAQKNSLRSEIVFGDRSRSPRESHSHEVSSLVEEKYEESWFIKGSRFSESPDL